MTSQYISRRIANQAAILRALHFGGAMQRGQLSVRSGVRKSSVTSIVTDLLEAGVVREEAPGSVRSPIALDAERVYAAAASILPRGIDAARVHADGRVVDRRFREVAPDTPPRDVVRILADCIAALDVPAGQRRVGIGIATPGLVDPGTGRSLRAVNLHAWRDIPLADWACERLGRPVVVDNDVRCQLWSSIWFDRLGAEAEDLLYVHISDGVACAILSHGRLLVGDRFAAGEIGHVRMEDEGRLCTCGRSDCVEAYCSVPAILGELAAIRPELALEGAAGLACAAAGEPAIENVLDRMARRLAHALSGVVAAIDPAMIVLGTPDRAFSELLKPRLQHHLAGELMGLQVEATPLAVAGDVETDAVRGIAGLAIERAFEQGTF